MGKLAAFGSGCNSWVLEQCENIHGRHASEGSGASEYLAPMVEIQSRMPVPSAENMDHDVADLSKMDIQVHTSALPAFEPATAHVYVFGLGRFGIYVGSAIGSAKPVSPLFRVDFEDRMTADEMEKLEKLSGMMGARLWNGSSGHLTHFLPKHQSPTRLFSEAFGKLRSNGFADHSIVLLITTSIAILHTVTQQPGETVDEMRGLESSLLQFVV